jgi:hypothetical protein
MKLQRRNFRSDTVAVSHVIGVVLMTAIFVTMFTIFQASVVPYWNKQVEAAELRVTHDDMMFLPSDLEDVAIHRTPKTCTVQLGARYPDRMIFRNPGPGAFGTLTVEEAPAQVIVIYNDGSELPITETFDSKRITYTLSGTINSPKLVYEHGVIIADWRNTMGENAIVTTDEQTLIDRNENLYIPIVNGSLHSKSAIGSETMAIYPYLYNDSINASWVKITLDTKYRELWDDTLFNASTVRPDLNLQNTTVEFGDNKIYINNTAQRYLKYPNQTASEPLYAGMISCSAEDPDGTGGGSGLWVAGEGTDIMATGSRVANIPSSATATAIVVQDMVVDKSGAKNVDLNGNFITITVTDYNGNWWKVLINFQKPNSIINIYIRSARGASKYKQTNFLFDSSTSIDLFNSSNFELSADDEHGIGGMYQNACVGSNNRLVTLIAHENNQKNVAMISYRLLVDGP